MKFSQGSLFYSGHLRHTRLWLWIGILMIVLVVFLSLIDPPQPVKQLLFHDKLIHCAVYASLMGWFAQIFRHDHVRLFLVVVFATMGIGVEFIQGMVPNREFEVLDMIANTSGAVLAWALSYTWFGEALVWFERTCLRATHYSG